MPQGRRFGKYLLHDKLAVGGMGELYLATMAGAAKGTPPSVLKILLPEYSSDADFVSMFHDEARIGMQLTHSNIVVVQDLGRVQDTPYLVMEYVHGENLRNVVRRMAEVHERFPADIAVRISIEVLQGLEYAHAANDSRGRPINVVHRDLSPDNVMLSFDGDVKILDFGIAKAEGRATQTQFGILKGKAQYMAPEQALGQPVDGRTDLYAVGLVLLEVITGERRFAADVDPIQQIRDARTWKPTEPSKRDSSLPVELDAILLKSMQLDAKRRFQTATEFADALRQLLRSGSLPRSGDNIPRLMRRMFPDRAEPFLLFEEEAAAPTKPSPRGGRTPAPEPPAEPSIEIFESTNGGSSGGFLGGTAARMANPDAATTENANAVRPRSPIDETTRPPNRGSRSKAVGTIDVPTESSLDGPTNSGADDGPTNAGFALDEPTREAMAQPTPMRGMRPAAPSNEATENDSLDDRTAVGARPPPSSRREPSRDDTLAPNRRREPTPPPSKSSSAPKFRDAPPPPPAKFRDVKNLRDLPEIPSADNLPGDEEFDGTRVAPGGRGPSRVSPQIDRASGASEEGERDGRPKADRARIDPPARIVERRRGDPPISRQRPRKRGVFGRLVMLFLFFLMFAAGIGAGLLHSGRVPPEIEARFEPLFALVPALRPPAKGTPLAVLGSNGALAMNSPTPDPAGTPGDDDDVPGDDDDDAAPGTTGKVPVGGGVFPGGGGDDDDGAAATPTKAPAKTPEPQPSRTAVAVVTPRPTERPVSTAATPKPTREVVAATPRPTPVVNAAGKASVKVISTPSGLEILVDGQGTGKKTPATVQIEPGTRVIGLKADGYRPWQFKETFAAGDTLQLPVDLQPL